MKKSLLLLAAVLTASLLYAQSPAGFQYQAVIRNEQSEPLENENVTVQFSLLEGSESGTVVYSESHNLQTNAFGLINATIGGGSTLSGDFSTVSWSSGTYFIKTEVDLGAGLVDFGTKQLLSVPFAMYGEDADADPNNEIQTLNLEGSTLSLSNGNSVDLGTLGADTDDQTLSLDGAILSISEGNDVDLSSFLDNTDTQLTEEQVDTFVANNGYLTVETDDQTISLSNDSLKLEDGGFVLLSSYKDNTDAQDLTLTDNTLSLTGDESTVDLSSFLDNTDEQDLSLSDNSLSLTGDETVVDLSGYLDNTDDQALSLSDNTLSLEDGGSADLSGYLDNTDEQDLTLTDNTLSLTGDETSVDLSGYLDNTDDQALSLSDNTLSLEEGGSVDLSGYMDNTDAQDLTLSDNTLSLTNDATTIDLSSYLDNTDDQTLSEVLANGADANATKITNLADPTTDQDAATKAYVDNEITSIADYNGSGDLALEVLDFGVAKDVDFSFSTGSGASQSGTWPIIGQSFTATTSGVLTQIDFPLNTNFNTTSIDFVLRNGSGTSGTELDRVSFTPAQGYRIESYILGSEVTVTAGQQYTFIIESTASNVQSSFRLEDAYTGGTAFYGSNAQYDFTSLTTYVRSRNTPKTAISANNESVGVGTESPDASAALEISSTTQGLLIPRMTTSQRDEISSPATGLLVYNTDDDEINKYDGAAWLGESNTLTEVLSNGADANSTAITNLADPSNAQDAATKAYVDNAVASENTNSSGNFEISEPSTEGVDVQQLSIAGASGGDDRGQSFKATKTGELYQIDFNARLITGSAVNFTLKVYEGEGFGGTLLVSESVTITTDLSGNSTHTFSNPPTVYAGSQYSFRLESDVADAFATSFSASNPYADGVMYFNGSPSANPITDWAFTTYVRTFKQTAINIDDDLDVGIGTDSPDPSAVLDVSSTTQGLLLPRMTTTQRDAISSPAAGLTIFNTTTTKFQGYTGSAWVDLH